ncbi:MAG: PTS sugar transporter subunit IIA [Desulfohalobium sp.]
MVGVIIITHLDLGEALLKAAENILGPQEMCISISLDSNKEMDESISALQQAVEEVDMGEGVLILTDMFGGTPSNLSMSLLGAGNYEVVTGVNLPLLLKLFGNREMSLEDLAVEVKSAGRQGILVAGEVLRRKVSNG